MTRLLVLLVFLAGAALAAPTNNLTLTWDWTDNSTNGIVYRGTASGMYTTNFPVMGTNVFSDCVPLSATYYYAVTAVNMFGDQSVYSSELMVQRIKPTPPVLQKYTVTLK